MKHIVTLVSLLAFSYTSPTLAKPSTAEVKTHNDTTLKKVLEESATKKNAVVPLVSGYFEALVKKACYDLNNPQYHGGIQLGLAEKIPVSNVTLLANGRILNCQNSLEKIIGFVVNLDADTQVAFISEQSLDALKAKFNNNPNFSVDDLLDSYFKYQKGERLDRVDQI